MVLYKCKKNIIMNNKKTTIMKTKKLVLSVEWENGIASNEIQAGVKPKHIILKNGERMLLEPFTSVLPREDGRESNVIGLLYLKDGKPTLFSQEMIADNMKEINQTLIGLGQCQSELASWYWRRHSEAETWNFYMPSNRTRPVLSLGSLLD